MSDLNMTEVLWLQRIISKKSKDKGYVWDFTNATFKAFVKDYTGIDIYDDKYIAEDGQSKMKRLKVFLKIEDNINVENLLEGLKEYGNKKYLSQNNINEINKLIKRLKSKERSIIIDDSLFENERKIELLINDINTNVSNKNFELAIDRLHTFFKGYIEKICLKMQIDIKDKSLDSLYGELLKCIHENNLIKEGVTKDILSSAKKAMKSFDYVRNNKSYAHSNNIMVENEAEFLCIYIIEIYKFISKINFFDK